MTTILVTGSTSGPGRPLVETLRSAGHDVRALSRRRGRVGHDRRRPRRRHGTRVRGRRSRRRRAPRDESQGRPRRHRAPPRGSEGGRGRAPRLPVDRRGRRHPVQLLPRQGRQRAGDRRVGGAVHDPAGDPVPLVPGRAAVADGGTVVRRSADPADRGGSTSPTGSPNSRPRRRLRRAATAGSPTSAAPRSCRGATSWPGCNAPGRAKKRVFSRSRCPERRSRRSGPVTTSPVCPATARRPSTSGSRRER